MSEDESGAETVPIAKTRKPKLVKPDLSAEEMIPRLEAGMLVLNQRLNAGVSELELLIKEAIQRIDALELRATHIEAAAKIEPPRLPAWVRPKAAQANPAWVLAPGTEFIADKSIGHQQLSDIHEFKLRAQFGYKPDGGRALSGSDLEAAYVLCEELVKAGTPEEADAVVMGAGNLPLDVATARICLGLTAGGKFGTTPLMVALKYYPEKSLEELLAGLTS